MTETASKISDAEARRNSRWDLSNAPRNYIWLVVFQGGSALFSFATVWLVTRYLGSEGYGGIVAIIAASQVAQVFVNWTSFSVTRFGVEEFVDTERIARTFWVRLGILAANMAVILSLAKFWFPPLAGWLRLPPEAFWLVVLHFVVIAFWLHIQLSFQGAKLPRTNSLLQMVERIILLGLFLGLIGLGWFDGFSAMSGYIIVPAAMACIGIYKLRKFVFFRFTIDRKFVMKLVAYSVPLLPFSLLGYFAGSFVDAIFISKYLSTKELGQYSVASQISSIALQLPILANSLLLPFFVTLESESDSEKTQPYFKHAVPGLTLIWGIGCSLAGLAGNYAIPLIFGDEFASVGLPLWVLLAASIVLFPVYIGYAPLSNSTSKTYISMYAAIFAASANIAGNFILIPRFGMAGSAWATLLANIIWFFAFALLLRRAVELPLSWTSLALVPGVLAATAFSVGFGPWLSLVTCLVASSLIVYIFKSSFRETISIVAKLVRKQA